MTHHNATVTTMTIDNPHLRCAHSDHSRQWQNFTYIYPVISRRSRGLSIGVNLSTNKLCNFNCVYCSVDRSTPTSPNDTTNLAQLTTELDRMLNLVTTNDIWLDPAFSSIPTSHRRLNDIAFSGNGEPTISPHFEKTAHIVTQLKAKHNLTDTKIIIITNATRLNDPAIARSLTHLDSHNLEIWAKLDAGSDSYYRQINQATIPYTQIIDNILACGQTHSITIQTLLMQIHNCPIPNPEFDAYIGQLESLLAQNCRITTIQLYTTARKTAQPYVTPLTNPQLDTFAQRLRDRIPQLLVETFYSTQ